jgi:SPP1 family predicted phage head-tail adaptor
MMREPVEFQRLTRTSDGAGGYSESWAAIADTPTRGMIKSMSGRERWASNRIEATSTHKMAVRYFSGLSADDRVVVRDRAYNIRFINNVDYDDTWLEIDLELGVAV